jgi:hypothetical protein
MKTIRQYIDKAGEKVAEFNAAWEAAKEASDAVCYGHRHRMELTKALEEYDQKHAEQVKAFRSAVYHVKNIYLILGLDVPEMQRPHQLQKALKHVALSFNDHQRRMNEFCISMNN